MSKLFTFSVMFVLLLSSLLNSQWLAQSSGTTKTLYCSSFWDESYGFACGDSNTLVKTSNGGTNWIIMSPPGNSTNYFASMLTENLNYIYLAQGYTGGVSGNGKILYSSNGGTNWITQMTTQYDMFSVAFINTPTGYAVGNGPVSGNDTLYKTTNNGSVWTPISSGGIGLMTYVYFYNSTTGFITSMTSSNILRTTNGGVNWSVVNTGTSQNGISQITMTDTNHVFAVANNETFLRSTNGGLNWTSQSYGTLDGMSVSFCYNSIGFMVCGKENPAQYKISKTSDFGATWTTTMTGTGKVYYNINFVWYQLGWLVGSGGTILKTTNMGGVWVGKTGTEVPQNYSLSQNYPNPFNPSTVIKYQIPANTNVVLKISDITGKEISTLVNEKQTAGTYEATFDASALSSGIYFYRIIAGDYVKTMKMILIK
jgi:photosystem II stability/assembly factor-like uncharacterized protein